MRNIVIAVDGTWNRPDQFDRDRQVPGNVVKMVRAVADSGQSDIDQLKYYSTGVGTSGLVDKMWGGAAGKGLFGDMRRAYAWLVQRHLSGDRIFLFGFSRGAFTVRSLAGMLQVCGLPLLREQLPPMQLAEEAARIYRIRDADRRKAEGAAFQDRYYAVPGVVHFLGVWDTVGAMGLPTKGPIGWATRARHRFHNVQLGDNVRHAYQALAINEQRAPFEPALWVPPMPANVKAVEQTWFCGVHSNIGGGYVDAGLSDIALKWMMDHAKNHGLVINPEYVARRVDPNVFGELRDSLSSLYRTPFTGLPRARVIGGGALGESVHPSVYQRWQSPCRPDDMPANLLQTVPVTPANLSGSPITDKRLHHATTQFSQGGGSPAERSSGQSGAVG